MSPFTHKILVCALFLCLGAAAQGRDWLTGLYQSPKGVGATVILDGSDRQMEILTLRTDFYGLLSGRTADIGACISFTHDYSLFVREGEDFRLQIHAGAGGMAGYMHDFEKGVLSATDRQLEHASGWTAALVGNLGLRVDFRRHLTLDLSFSLTPGAHLRTDPGTGALIVSLYRNGLYHVYYPQLNLMYRF